MTPAQIELGRHALGLPNRTRRSYRNHFCAGPEHFDWQDWMQMVASGDARRYPATELSGGDDVFKLTRMGAEACLHVGELLDKEEWRIR